MSEILYRREEKHGIKKWYRNGDSSMTMEKCATARLTSAEQAATRISPSSFIVSSVSYSTRRAVSPLHFRLSVARWRQVGGKREGKLSRKKKMWCRGFGPFPTNRHSGSNKETWNAQCLSLCRTFFRHRRKLRTSLKIAEGCLPSRKGIKTNATRQRNSLT